MGALFGDNGPQNPPPPPPVPPAAIPPTLANPAVRGARGNQLGAAAALAGQTTKSGPQGDLTTPTTAAPSLTTG